MPPPIVMLMMPAARPSVPITLTSASREDVGGDGVGGVTRRKAIS